MNCETASSAMMEALKTSPPSPELQAHLEACPTCAEEFRELGDMWTALGDLPQEAPRPGVALALQARLRPRPWRRWPLLAAALLLLVLGYGLGRRASVPEATPALFRQPSAGGRLTAIAMLTPDQGPSPVEALLDLVAKDPDPRVRLSAVEALYLYGEEAGRNGRLTQALRTQSEPRVQMALVDLMVALREKRAVEALKRLLREGRLDPDVRKRVQQRLKELAV